MNEQAVLLQPAFILQHRNFRESSLIIDVLTRDFGVVSILAKGARNKRSSTAGLLLPFASLKLSFQGKADLKVLTGTELITPQQQLTGIALFCGFYVNELICNFLHKHDPHPEVFNLYRHCLHQLRSADNIEQTLRFFELKLLQHIGYAFSLHFEGSQGTPPVSLDKRYLYESGIGMVSHQEGYIGGKTLLALGDGAQLDRDALAETKQLMRAVLNDHLQGKVLKSRAVLANVIKYLQ